MVPYLENNHHSNINMLVIFEIFFLALIYMFHIEIIDTLWLLSCNLILFTYLHIINFKYIIIFIGDLQFLWLKMPTFI